ncbi:Heat shock protein 33 [Piscirickettsia salmonis]|uniref:Molecular chaperone Hsp33 n=1 Tax=Piscirickettsia salmonis TaxID=1238 RepID=A0A1L6TG96_PISSA|nr:Hsp33 family molecular chaperone HslO [Piscirickettsia salmonis]AKP74656.1 molecular chaperone [Piscirickettsia salmonis LF-89 = ATCC VR-1361]ALB21427.1 molecular chaperone Hsp33 [Piscirickettsia salmonis]ALY01658.1 molecular chaperone [Piscirickettsia salmonis]AMA41170.1 molecular chaperone [Piscirickettsia salmonis]AOS36359.1 molecular chaperone [Piscirickettsia salmonis]
MHQYDSVQRFLFNNCPVRGQLVHLNQSFRHVIQQHSYPAIIRNLLGEALAVTVLMRNTVKFTGKITLQLQGNGPLKMLVAQCNDKLEFRGVAHFDEQSIQTINAAKLSELLGQGHCVITMEPDNSTQRHQGVVTLTGDTLSTCIEHYFASSEQLATRIWLASHTDHISALLLQQLPHDNNQESLHLWEHLTTLAQTITDKELLTLDNETLLYRLFHQEQARLFPAQTVSFKCQCSKTNFIAAIKTLPTQECHDLLEQDGHIEMTCDYCNQQYHFSADDLKINTH